MKIFDPTKHYTSYHPSAIIDRDFYINQPTDRGLERVFQYLNRKYQTNIVHPIKNFGVLYRPNDPQHHLKQTTEYVRLSSIYDIVDIKPYLIDAKKQPGDYREAYIIAHQSHALFMAYIKEGGKEAILYSDSIGTGTEFTNDMYKRTGIKVFTNIDKRQKDHKSCFTDGVIMGRDITAIDPQTKKYRIHNLLDELESREEKEEEGLSLVKLPNMLLKTAQCLDFVKFHKNCEDSKKIHKNENLDEFRTRYAKEVLTKEGKENLSSYLQVKSIKYSKIIQIQYYLNQIEKTNGPLPEEKKNEFIFNSKKILKDSEKNSLHNFAENFLNDLNLSTLKDNISDPAVTIQKLKINLNQEILRIAQKYGLSAESLFVEFNKLNEEIDKLNLATNKGYPLLKEEKKALTIFLKNKVFGLAITELMLLNPNPNLPSSFWGNIAQVNLSYADLITHSHALIHQFYLNKVLFSFCYNNAYLAKKVLNNYPDLLRTKEQKALTWVSRYKTSDSTLCMLEAFASTRKKLIENQDQIIADIKGLNFNFANLDIDDIFEHNRLIKNQLANFISDEHDTFDILKLLKKDCSQLDNLLEVFEKKLQKIDLAFEDRLEQALDERDRSLN